MKILLQWMIWNFPQFRKPPFLTIWSSLSDGFALTNCSWWLLNSCPSFAFPSAASMLGAYGSPRPSTSQDRQQARLINCKQDTNQESVAGTHPLYFSITVSTFLEQLDETQKKQYNKSKCVVPSKIMTSLRPKTDFWLDKKGFVTDMVTTVDSNICQGAPRSSWSC